jgi:hypothetical protein
LPAFKAYLWFGVNPGTTVGLYNHGWSDNEAGVWSAIGWYDNAAPGTKKVELTVGQGRVYRHVDGTVARTGYVTNNSPDWAIIQLQGLYENVV